MKAAKITSPSLIPESVRNIIASINCASRVVLATCEGAERAVSGIDDVATAMLKQQHSRLLAELDQV